MSSARIYRLTVIGPDRGNDLEVVAELVEMAYQNGWDIVLESLGGATVYHAPRDQV